MEVREQRVDRTELVRRANEQPRFSFDRFNPTVFVGRFQRAHRSRSNRDDPSAVRPHAIERRSRCRRQPAPLGMHAVVAETLHGNRAKRADADMQRDELDVDAPRLQFFQQRGREMQSRRWCRNRSGMFGEHGLIPVHVFRVQFVALDVGRKRRCAELFERFQRRDGNGRFRGPDSVVVAGNQLQREFAARLRSVGGRQRNALTRLQPAPRLADEFPTAGIVRREKEPLPFSAG